MIEILGKLIKLGGGNEVTKNRKRWRKWGSKPRRKWGGRSSRRNEQQIIVEEIWRDCNDIFLTHWVHTFMIKMIFIKHFLHFTNSITASLAVTSGTDNK